MSINWMFQMNSPLNKGAAGTFVVRKPVSQATLRAELARRLPFETHIMIVSGGEILRLTTARPLAGEPSAADIIHFVSVLAKQRKPSEPLPLSIPPTGAWELRIVGQQGRFAGQSERGDRQQGKGEEPNRIPSHAPGIAYAGMKWPRSGPVPSTLLS